MSLQYTLILYSFLFSNVVYLYNMFWGCVIKCGGFIYSYKKKNTICVYILKNPLNIVFKKTEFK